MRRVHDGGNHLDSRHVIFDIYTVTEEAEKHNFSAVKIKKNGFQVLQPHR